MPLTRGFPTSPNESQAIPNLPPLESQQSHTPLGVGLGTGVAAGASTTLKPCLVCGLPIQTTRCPEHTIAPAKASAAARGYGQAWRRLSVRARRMQPFCSDCGTEQDLTVDHSSEAWRRQAAGLAIRLVDVEVVCRGCNTRRGAARGAGVEGQGPGPLGKAQSRLNTPGGIR